jgi:hypothetical protein
MKLRFENMRFSPHALRVMRFCGLWLALPAVAICGSDELLLRSAVTGRSHGWFANLVQGSTQPLEWARVIHLPLAHAWTIGKNSAKPADV